MALQALTLSAALQDAIPSGVHGLGYVDEPSKLGFGGVPAVRLSYLAVVAAFSCCSLVAQTAQDEGPCKKEDSVTTCKGKSGGELRECLAGARKAHHDWLSCQAGEAKLHEEHLHSFFKSSNGIEVMKPQQYDSALLVRMLAAAQARLASLNVLDQNSVVSKLGLPVGASDSNSSVSISLQALHSTQTPSAPTAPTPTAPTITVPTPTSASASDILNEQIQLSDQIANLTLPQIKRQLLGQG